MTTPPAPQPGWYPDPSGAPRQRYFDGRAWTEHYSAPTQQLAGPPPRKKNRTPLIVGSVVALVVAIAILGSMGGGDKTPSSTSVEQDSAASAAPFIPSTAAAPSTPTAAPVGSAVRDGKFEFQVLDIATSKTVSDPTGNPYMTATAQGTFVVITLSVKNIGNEPQNYFGQNQKVIDSSGREYSPNSEADMYMNTDVAPLGDINPGNSIQVKVPFDVPPGTNLTELELHDSMFSGGVSIKLA